ncbi:MAG: hypothetical protein ACJAZP_001104 [Psychromonas sp.]|uniref:hypothetical protein n=1 Tax=Psychromonas sp. TaxID=1884585 RepID=UPI0039E55CA6
MLTLEEGNIYSYLPGSLKEIVIDDKIPEYQQKLVIDAAKSANPDMQIKLTRLKKDTYQL